ncbi:glycosyltransferase family 4 protein [Sphingomonas corticis]|jgi:glycosyltransferase involved in cell wall biosynthesis|uniref:Glycosyltransferase family 4 protein n=1 Tax=Sphingomonas corticis TaxID=2722791 RepID=A0ABX1CUF7_9SPHN|nr:glycosyltransferase family 4 protein [Sphingomonas corticis]NJR79487.1 glycosyltransferase family 4 protein [Sphingomonas corticis]
MRKRRVLMTADSVGGVWQYATDLAVALSGDHDVTIAHMGPGSVDEVAGVRVIATGLPLDWLAEDAAAVRAAAAAIVDLARSGRAEVVQLNSPALAAAATFDVPVVAVDHGAIATWWEATRPGEPLPARYAWHAALAADGLRRADAVVVPSAAYGAAVRRRYGLPVDPVAVHNGRAVPPKSGATPARRAFTAGRLWDAAKATPLLDAVAARLPFAFEAAGPLIAPHGETVAPAHLAHLGTLGAAALAERLSARPMFVSAARFEPFGLAVLEAAGAGCPLVLADMPVFRELWQDAALFVAGEDPAHWADAIARLADDPAEACRLGDAAAARAARYTPTATARAMARLYARVAAPAMREVAA